MKVDYIDHMGSDLTIVNSARVSFNKESENVGEDDEKLIKYLASHNHWTPFSHAVITMREKVPIFVARQRFKHMIGFTYNEVSRRYVSDKPEFYSPKQWRKKPEKSVKQGSGEEFTHKENKYYKTVLDNIHSKVSQVYEHLLEMEVAPEQARMVLPQSMNTEYYVTGSLAAWARAYKLRIDRHAQKEIQELAEQWGKIIEPHFPVSWKELVQ